MVKAFILCFILGLTTQVFGYNKPNSIAYDASRKSYYISNQNGKTITCLDSNFNTSEVITGLVSPKDLLFASFGPYDGLLVLDSNNVKVFNAADYSFIASFAVSGSIDLEDAEIDKNQSGVFYISDPRAHVIFKAVVGGAPFYIPTFSTFCTTVRNPKALLFDSKNRLLVTTDSLKSEVYELNTSSGNSTLLYTTTIDYINSIEEDLQGNFYATSWGDSYIYRLDQNFDNAVGLAIYSKPAGLLFNPLDDLIAMACSNCNKVDFFKLHMVYINDADSAKCPGDTFYLNINQQFKGRGTYNSSNKFIAELSDANGSFKNPLSIGIESSEVEPSAMKLSLPTNKRFSGSGYKIRIKSSNPVFYSINDLDAVLPFVPVISLANSDTIAFCSPAQIVLGQKKDIDSAFVNYLWSENGKSIAHSLSWLQKNFTVKSEIKLTKMAKLGKCFAKDSVILWPSSQIFIPYKDSIVTCENNWIALGGDPIANTSIEWSSKKYPAIRTEFSPVYQINARDTFLVKVSSLNGSCTSQKNVYVYLSPRPKFQFNRSQLYTCSSTIIDLEPIYLQGNLNNLKFVWLPKRNLHSSNLPNIRFQSYDSGQYNYKFLAIDSVYNCYDSQWVKIKNLEQPNKPILGKNANGAVIKNFNKTFDYQWIKDGKFVNQSTNDSQFVVASGESKWGNYRVVVLNKDSVNCTDTSASIDLLEPGQILKFKGQKISLYPNPATDNLMIKGINQEFEFAIFGLGGELLQAGSSLTGAINIRDLVEGMYIIQINFEGQIQRTRFNKH